MTNFQVEDVPSIESNQGMVSLEQPGASSEIVGAVLKTAHLYPDRPALIENGTEISYAVLKNRVRHLAFLLGQDCGTVGVLVTRSANTIVALLGVLAAGGTYCPIDPKYPMPRQEALLQAGASATLISTQPGLMVPSGVRVINPSDYAQQSSISLRTKPAPADPDSAAYLLFTSGSTGTPKGVLTSRRAIAASVTSLREFMQISPADKVLQFAALNWDTCFEEIFPALTSGAALVIDDEAHTGSHARLIRMIAAREISVLDLPTAFWHELVQYLTEDNVGLPDCVRTIIIGGEAARSARLAEWCALDTGRIRLINTYGCTETTLVTHATDLHGPLATPPAVSWEQARDVPIGRHMPHVIEHIAENGELFIGGPALAIGYLHLPELTAERFSLRDVGQGRQRYYRSGDRVSRMGNGSLVHHGRLDSQIKVRGIRVDPGEVEIEISAHPCVSVAAVVGVTTADHSSLVAYVVPRQLSSSETLGEEMFAYLRNRLPAHLVPSKINIVSELVYTSSGKIDRAGLHTRHAAQFKKVIL
jgi:amino acid adenylation domain-containing protein